MGVVGEDDLSSTLVASTSEWYKSYYAEKGSYRNDLLANPEVLFQILANERSLIEALRESRIQDCTQLKVIDIGCGGGLGLLTFLRIGCVPSNLYGIDIQPDRIAAAERALPGVSFVCGDASIMPFENCSFDLVYQSTMFMQLTDNSVRAAIAKEMVRVVRPEGTILLTDWRYGSLFSGRYRPLNKRAIEELFSRHGWKICRSFSGALVPPIGRFLSRHLPSFYFLISKLPLVVGTKTWVLRYESISQNT